MKVQIEKGETLGGRVKVISSKSVLHRLLIMSALADKKTTISYSCKLSKDVLATIDCLTSAGSEIVVNEEKEIIEVTPLKISKEKFTINCKESGSTLRFILPVFCALGLNFEVLVEGRLSSRPLSPLYEILVLNGVKMSENGVYPLSVSGKLDLKEVQINGNVSSQFISGLLMASAILGGGKIKVLPPFESKPYVYITTEVMSYFGVKVAEYKDEFEVDKTKIISPKVIDAEGDWSNGGFLLSLGALVSKVEIVGLKSASTQGDREIARLLSLFGTKVEKGENLYVAEKGELNGQVIDASLIPDLVPILAVVGAVSKGRTEIVNAGRLRLKESDRISSVVNMINSLGGRAEERSDGIVIRGVERLKGGVVNSFNDHRIVMASAIACAKCDECVIIENANAVDKSYPEFFEVLKDLGFKVKEI